MKAKLNIHDRFALRSQAERYRDRFQKGWRSLTHRRETKALDQVLRSLGRMPMMMDVACGPGRFSEVLASYCDRLVQTDLSRHMLDLSREDHPSTNHMTFHFVADARRLPLSDQAVDLLFCHRFLNHIHDPQDRTAILRELARVAKRYVVVSCLGPPSLVRRIRRIYARLIGRFSLHQNVGPDDLMQSAKQTGLVYRNEFPISVWGISASYLVFVKNPPA